MKAPRENTAGDMFSAQDILAVVTGLADRETARRVWAASLSDRDLRTRLALSLPPEDEDGEIAEAVQESEVNTTESTHSFRDRLQGLTAQFATKEVKPIAPVRIMELTLTILANVLTLPCMSPAVAAPDPMAMLDVPTETIVTGENVRIEFQQLPPLTAHPHSQLTLRVLLDASALGERFSASSGYNTAFVTLEESSDILPVPTRHTLLVRLNGMGRGFTDVPDFPPARASRRLVAVTLSHLPAA